MMKRLLISMLILFLITGCVSNPPALPTTDPCLALHTLGIPECRPPANLPEAQSTRPKVPTTHLRQEISLRFKAIGAMLEQEPMTQGDFLLATVAIYAYGTSSYEELKNWNLKDLLIRLEGITPEKNRPGLQKIRGWFEALEGLGPQYPFSEAEPADPQKVQAARDLFNQIEAEWQLFLEQVK